MRSLMSHILFTIYLVYLLASSFPALTWCIYQDISSFGKQTQTGDFSQVTEIGDVNYLNAIKDRAGMNDDNNKRVPEKVSNENINITCVISERINIKTNFCPAAAKHFTYLNIYIDNFPEVAVPPPRSA